MYRVAMNVAISQLKTRKKKVSTIFTELENLNIADQDFEDSEERLYTLQMHIKDLNLFDKGILMLYLESKSHEEIAEIVGISKSNVGTKLSRIKDKLRQQVTKTHSY